MYTAIVYMTLVMVHEPDDITPFAVSGLCVDCMACLVRTHWCKYTGFTFVIAFSCHCGVHLLPWLYMDKLYKSSPFDIRECFDLRLYRRSSRPEWRWQVVPPMPNKRQFLVYMVDSFPFPLEWVIVFVQNVTTHLTKDRRGHRTPMLDVDKDLF